MFNLLPLLSEAVSSVRHKASLANARADLRMAKEVARTNLYNDEADDEYTPNSPLNTKEREELNAAIVKHINETAVRARIQPIMETYLISGLDNPSVSYEQSRFENYNSDVGLHIYTKHNDGENSPFCGKDYFRDLLRSAYFRVLSTPREINGRKEAWQDIVSLLDLEEMVNSKNITLK